MNIIFKLLVIFIGFLSIAQANLGNYEDFNNEHYLRRGESSAFRHHTNNNHNHNHNHYKRGKRGRGNHDQRLSELEYNSYGINRPYNKYYNNNNGIIQTPGTPREKSEIEAQHNLRIERKRFNDNLKKQNASNLQICTLECHRTFGNLFDQKKKCYATCHSKYKLKFD